MKKSDIYYGPHELPKGKRRPSMKEAVEANQVKYYGVHKVDQILVNAKIKAKAQTKSELKKLEQSKMELFANAVKLKKMDKKIQVSKSTAEKNDLKNEVDKLLKNNNNIKTFIEQNKPIKVIKKVSNKPIKEIKVIKKVSKKLNSEDLELKKKIELLNDERLRKSILEKPKKTVLEKPKKSVLEKPKKADKEELELNQKINHLLDRKKILEEELKYKELSQKNAREYGFADNLEIDLRNLSYLSNPESTSYKYHFKLPSHEFKLNKQLRKKYEDLLPEYKKILTIDHQNRIKKHIAEYERNDDLVDKIDIILSDNESKLNEVEKKLKDIRSEYMKLISK